MMAPVAAPAGCSRPASAAAGGSGQLPGGATASAIALICAHQRQYCDKTRMLYKSRSCSSCPQWGPTLHQNLHCLFMCCTCTSFLAQAQAVTAQQRPAGTMEGSG